MFPSSDYFLVCLGGVPLAVGPVPLLDYGKLYPCDALENIFNFSVRFLIDQSTDWGFRWQKMTAMIQCFIFAIKIENRKYSLREKKWISMFFS